MHVLLGDLHETGNAAGAAICAAAQDTDEYTGQR